MGFVISSDYKFVEDDLEDFEINDKDLKRLRKIYLMANINILTLKNIEYKNKNKLSEEIFERQKLIRKFIYDNYKDKIRKEMLIRLIKELENAEQINFGFEKILMNALLEYIDKVDKPDFINIFFNNILEPVNETINWLSIHFCNVITRIKLDYDEIYFVVNKKDNDLFRLFNNLYENIDVKDIKEYLRENEYLEIKERDDYGTINLCS